jgi:hypothetical protein
VPLTTNRTTWLHATSADAAAHLADHNTLAAKVNSLDGALAAPTTFDQSANALTLTTIPAAVNTGTLTLLSDVITAIATLQTAINNNTKVLNAVIDTLQSAGLAL